MGNEINISTSKAILHTITCVILFIILSLTAIPFYELIENAALAEAIGDIVRIILTYFIFRLYCERILKISFADCRVQKPTAFMPWLISALLLPCFVSGVLIFCIPGVWQSNSLTGEQLASLLSAAVFGVCLCAGLTEELVFRGVIMRILQARWGNKIAVIVPSVLFGLLHIVNMRSFNLLDLIQLLIAGTAVGVMFSVITIQSNSIFPAALIHGIWNLIIIGGIVDIATEQVGHYDTTLFTYTLTSNSTLMTGGAFGIEASLPAIIGYIAVTVFAIILIKKKTNGQLNA